MSNNLHATRWTDDPAQQEQFFTAVRPRIHGESKYMARVYGVGTYLEDIEAEVKAKLWQQMLEIDPDGPFAKDSPEEAADFFLEKENYRIREWARSSARKEADKLKKQSGQTKEADEHKKQSGQADDLADICWPKKQSRQADDLANIRQQDLPPDIEKELLTTARGIGVIAEISNFTSRERDMFRKESLRQIGVDDLDASLFDQAAQSAGTSGSEVRAYIKDHDEDGHSSASDRKAWSRARAKVAKALTRAAITSLLAIIFALSVALLNAVHQGRSDHQNDLVHQGNLIDEVARAHQENLSGEIARDHQDKLGDEIALTHQSKLLDEIAPDHQDNLI